MICDLHIHSDFSDSSRSVEEVLDLAVEKSLDYIAFADHDTTETYQYASQAIGGRDIGLISSVEISAYDFKRKRKVHILGYSYESDNNIKDLCDQVLDRRKANSEKQREIIEENGYELNEDKLYYSKNSKETLYKQQIMYSLVGKPYYTEEYQSLYQKLFKNNGIAQMDIDYVDVYDAVKAVLADGGIPVIAHPGLLDNFELIPELIKEGLRGIEIYHPENSMDQRKILEDMARKYDLIRTGGSDDHGIFGSQHQLGTSQIPSEDLQKILA